jgi:NTE family protein
MGALVGACYAAFPNARKVHEAFLRFIYSEQFPIDRFDFFRDPLSAEEVEEPLPGPIQQFKKAVQRGVFYGSSVVRRSFVPEEDFRKGIEMLLPDLKIEQLSIPFVAVATDLSSGHEVLLSAGPLRGAVLASSAIPGVFPPVSYEGRELVDGSWVHNVPVEPVRKLGADIVIAVDISREIQDTSNWRRGLNIVFRTNAITRSVLQKIQLQGSDVCLRPDIGRMHWGDFREPEECIAIGREEAYRKLPLIRSVINQWASRDIKS